MTTAYQQSVVDDIHREIREGIAAGERKYGPGFCGVFYFSACEAVGTGRWVSSTASKASRYVHNDRETALEELIRFSRKLYGAGALKATEVTVGMQGRPGQPFHLRNEVSRIGQGVGILRAYAIVAEIAN